MTFRRFLYLDEKLVQEFISQADSGVLEEQTITQTKGKDGKIGIEGKAGVLTGKAERGKISTEEVAQVLRQTPESQYNRLHNWLETSGRITDIFAHDEIVWGELSPNEILAVQCDLEIPHISRILSSPEELEAASYIAPLFGQTMDEGTQAAIEGITALSRSSEQRIFAVGTIEEEAAKFVATIKKESLRVSYEELESEVTIVGALDKKVPAGSRHLIFNLPGMNMLPRAERRRIAQAPDADPSLFVEGPLGTITPLAIFYS